MKIHDVFHEDGTLFKTQEPITHGEAVRFDYFNTHLPTGNVYPESALFVNRHAFLSCLRLWNGRGGRTWKYTGEDPRP